MVLSRRALLALPAMLDGGCRSQAGRVRVAIFRGEEMTPLANALGHFAAEGLDVEVIELASTSKAMQAMFGGSAEVVTGGYDHAIHLAAEGRQARSFLVLTTRSPLALVSRRIRRIEDLKGANVGISAFGSSGQHFVNYLLHRHGLSEKDVKFAITGGGHSVTVASIEQGRLDAVVTLPPSLAILRARIPDLAVLANGTTIEGTREVFGVDQYPGVCMMAQASWIAANRDTVTRLSRRCARRSLGCASTRPNNCRSGSAIARGCRRNWKDSEPQSRHVRPMDACPPAGRKRSGRC